MGRAFLFAVNDEGILDRAVEAQEPIVMPDTLKVRMLYMSHYSVTAAYPREKRMHTSLRRNFYLPGLALDCYPTVKQCGYLRAEQSSTEHTQEYVISVSGTWSSGIYCDRISRTLPEIPQGNFVRVNDHKSILQK